MDAYQIQFYDLLSRALGAGESIQSFLDSTMAQKYNALQLDGFTFEPFMQTDFTYEQIVGELGLNVMAQYYDVDSPALPDGTLGFKSYTGKIPRMKKVEYFNEDKLRKMKLIEDRKSTTPEQVALIAYQQLFITIDKLIGGHTNALTYQRHQAVSTGKFVINNTNNPKGIKNITLDYHVPSGNKTTLTSTARWWTSSTHTQANEGSAANPVKDLTDIVAKARYAGVLGHFEVEIDYLKEVLSHSKVLAQIGVATLPASDSTAQVAYAGILSYEAKKSALESLIGAPIKAIDSLVPVESIDKTEKAFTRSNINAFEKNVFVFVPDGEIGVVKTVEPIAIEGGNYASFYGGRLLLTVGVDFVKKCQSYNTEMTSLVIPTAPQLMWYLYPNEV
ncbi:MAG: hypothetical protein IK114_14320 [Fibrobacter sp.]|nr:hypothetical protein [Fibrobacter sp.]